MYLLNFSLGIFLRPSLGKWVAAHPVSTYYLMFPCLHLFFLFFMETAFLLLLQLLPYLCLSHSCPFIRRFFEAV